MSSVIIYNSGSTQKPYSVAVTVAAEATKQDSEVTLLDIEKFTYIHQGLPPAWYARIFGHRVYRDSFRKYLGNLGVVYEQLPRPKKRAPEERLPEHMRSELDDAVASDLFTYVRTDRLDDDRWFAKFTARKMKQASSPLYVGLIDYLRAHKTSTIYIPNGRVAHQRLAILAAKEVGCGIKFYEIGRALPNSAYIGNCQIHDREATQIEARSLIKKKLEASNKKTAEEWLKNRMAPESSINPFSRVWENQSKTNESTKADITAPEAVIFLSSTDEFSSYGAKWASQTWIDQFHAFSMILRILEQKGVSCTLRVHPNLINKGAKYVKRELEKVGELKSAFPSLRVVGHRDPVNSYELVKDSDYVFVGRSTLGLEANLLGKCVWTTTPARYDDIADVRKLHHPEDVNEDSLALWKANPSGAQAFVSYWVSQDFPFVVGDSEWCDWNLNNPPLSLRLGNVLLGNHLLHSLHLVAHELLVSARKAR